METHRLERYSRHLLLPDIDIEGQQRLLNAAVLIVGVGGLGCPAATYLAGSGIGQLTIVDDDRVDLGNLQRQTLYTTTDIGRLKTDSARERLQALNPDVHVRTFSDRIDGRTLTGLLDGIDAVLDCSDNFATRFAINAVCARRRVPLIWGAATGVSGQATVFDFRRPDSPCVSCLYPDQPDAAPGGCAAAGVLAPLTGIIGCVMAVETIKILAGFGAGLCGRLLVLDSGTMTWRMAALSQDPACPICSASATKKDIDAARGTALAL